MWSLPVSHVVAGRGEGGGVDWRGGESSAVDWVRVRSEGKVAGAKHAKGPCPGLNAPLSPSSDTLQTGVPAFSLH